MASFVRGQAAVESAIVLPLFVFLVLAIIQLGLANQAKLMTKLAAYNAARGGALRSISQWYMERAAARTLLPFFVSGAAGQDTHKPVHTAALFEGEWTALKTAAIAGDRHFYDPSRGGSSDRFARHLDVTICNPHANMLEAQGRFDNPVQMGSGTVAAPEQGSIWQIWSVWHLNVQVSFYYRMPIPFANGIIWWIARGGGAQRALRVLRMGAATAVRAAVASGGEAGNDPPLRINDFYGLATNRKIYVIPIRASYGLQMQSDALGTGDVTLDGYRIPSNFDKNYCVSSGNPFI